MTADTSSSERPAGSTRSASFLVRFWEEPREAPGSAPVLRGYLRNLASGEEQYVRNLRQLAVHLERHLGLEFAAEASAEPEAERSVGSNGIG